MSKYDDDVVRPARGLGTLSRLAEGFTKAEWEVINRYIKECRPLKDFRLPEAPYNPDRPGSSGEVNFALDGYVEEIIAKHRLRAAEGQRVFGNRWEAWPLERLLEEMQQEAMDFAVYIEKTLWLLREERDGKAEGGTGEAEADRGTTETSEDNDRDC